MSDFVTVRRARGIVAGNLSKSVSNQASSSGDESCFDRKPTRPVKVSTGKKSNWSRPQLAYKSAVACVSQPEVNQGMTEGDSGLVIVPGSVKSTIQAENSNNDGKLRLML
jgi:hypothetical protein